MAIDPRILEQALLMDEQGVQPDGSDGITQMLTPQFNPTEYAEAGALPSLDLNLSEVVTPSGVNDLSFDPSQFLQESLNMNPALRQDVNDEVGQVLQNALAGDEEDGLRATAALGLDSSGISQEDTQEGYKGISDLIQEGGLPAVEQFIREVYTEGNNKEVIPEWALPASLFGTFLMNEPGDWKQAILRAKGKTASAMFQNRQAQAAGKAKLDLDIRKKAVDLFAANELSADKMVGLIGKVTPKSLEKYGKTKKISDLRPSPATKDVGSLLKDFTASSVGDFQKSGDYNSLIRLPGTGEKGNTTLDFLKEFTPASVKEYENSKRMSPELLVRKPGSSASDALSVSDMTTLMETYTPVSVDVFKNSKNAVDLIEKDGSGFSMPKVNTDSMLNEQAITKMTTPAYIDKQLSVMDAQGNPDMDYRKNMLRNYTMLYKQTIDTATAKISGEQVKERLPFAEFTPLQYASKLGLDANDSEVATIANVPQLKLPKATAMQLGEYNALLSTKKDMEFMRKILELAPDNITGIKGEFFNTDAARILADISPFDIPQEASVAQIYNQASELRLVKAILNEDRFSDPDRRLVNEFISGKSFASRFAKLESLKKVEEVINRQLSGVEFELDGRRVPEGFYAGETQDTSLEPEQRREQLINNLLELSKNRP